MKNIRIIPCLDIKGPKLVKGIHLDDLRVLCKPEDFAKKYYRCGADAICISSLLCYSLMAKFYNTEDNYKDEGNIDFLKSKTINKRFIKSDNLTNIKNAVASKNIFIRI